MWSSHDEFIEQFRATTVAARPPFTYRVYDVWDNNEFLTGATVDLIDHGRVIETVSFVGSTEFEESYREGTGQQQAVSYALAWLEVMETPLEERLAPFGPEFEREWNEERGLI